MPAAPDLPTLFDVETEAENVFYDYLAGQLGLPGVESDSNATLGTPRLEIIATLIEEGMHQITIPSGTYAGTTFYDQKLVRMTLDLVYSPARPQDPNILRGKFRQLMANYPLIKAQFAINGYYAIAPDSLRQVSGNRTIDQVEKTETISTTINAVLFVMATGFPT